LHSICICKLRRHPRRVDIQDGARNTRATAHLARDKGNRRWRDPDDTTPTAALHRLQQTSRRGRRAIIPTAAAARGSVQSGFNEVVLQWHTVVGVARHQREQLC
jgi:hypothetical protein